MNRLRSRFRFRGFLLVVLLILGVSSSLSVAQICATPPAGLVGWWAGDGNADDIAGTNPASLINGTTFSSGEVDEAFSFDGIDDFLSIPSSASLDVGAGNGFSFESWINPADVAQTHMILEWNDGSGGIGLHLYHSDPGVGGSGALVANLVSISGSDHVMASGPGTIVAGTFQHIALTYDKTTGIGKLFYNGSPVVTQNLGVFTPQTSYGLYLGTRVSGPAGVGSYFSGLLDEPSLYSRALQDSEILAIFNAGVAGKCKMEAPVILSQPASTTVLAGRNATFSVAASGFSMSFHWQFNNTDIPGATNTTLELTNIQTNQAGNYSVAITNIYGSTNSEQALLTVDPTCVSASPGLVGWWPGEGDPSDHLHENNAIAHGSLGFAPGESGLAFAFNGTNAYLTVPARSNLDVGAGDGLTIECWIKPADISSSHAIAEFNNGSGSIGLHFWHSDSGIGGLGGLFANLKDISGGSHILASSANLLVTNAFQHVALIYNRTNGLAKIFRNGVAVASANLGSFRPQTTYPCYFGTRPSGPSAGGYFKGLIDEIAIYNRALPDSEIQAVFYAGSAGKSCIPPEVVVQPPNQRAKPGTNVTFTAGVRGTLPLAYQWRFNNSNIGGATNSSLTLTNVQPNAAGNYSLRITNSLGSTTSSNALLKIDVVFAFGNGQPLTNSQASFGGPVTVQLTNVYANGQIFYTLDGSTPTFASVQYTGAFLLTHDATLRVLGYSADFSQSAELDPVNIFIVPTYTLTTNSAGGGSIALSPPGGSYLSNTVVNLTATPAAGWIFLQWLGDVTGTNAAISLAMTRNKFVQAVFGTTLNTSSAGNGSLSLNPPGGIYPYGTVVWLTAIPQPGSYFGIWGSAASGNTNPLSFGVTNPNPTVSSLFGSVSAGQAALTVVPVGNGRISVSPRANVYTAGQTVTVTATPDSGQSFVGWSGDASGSQNPLSLLVDQSKLIYANFTHKPVLSVRASFEGLKPEGFESTLTGDFGARYQIDASSNLVNWTPLAALTNLYGTSEFLDPAATSFSRRYYRALLLP